MSPVCARCRRPKATPADLIRWRSADLIRWRSDGEVCWIELDHTWLTPDEESAHGHEGVELLKERLSDMRKWRARFTCSSLEMLDKAARRR